MLRPLNAAPCKHCFRELVPRGILAGVTKRRADGGSESPKTVRCEKRPEASDLCSQVAPCL
jgi:hypothetical protein